MKNSILRYFDLNFYGTLRVASAELFQATSSRTSRDTMLISAKTADGDTLAWKLLDAVSTPNLKSIARGLTVGLGNYPEFSVVAGSVNLRETNSVSRRDGNPVCDLISHIFKKER